MANGQVTALKHQFDDLEQQYQADRLGMWVFLASEMLLFGGLFLAYAIYRSVYPEAWAEGSHHNDIIYGTINTGILLVSSLTVALAVHEAEHKKWNRVAGFLGATVVLGVIFLGVKFYEYYLHYQSGVFPGVRFHVEGQLAPYVALFFIFYFIMTGLHAVHMIIGLGVVSIIGFRAWQHKLTDHMPVEIGGLYWHLIDIIWVFLYPLLYLVE